ncbi:MAG: HIRAN domain-containing protein [Verrucomicrobia bacterium]|nr:HIRAN domain-containing protein [Verrucomicrobiota bacterium]
MKTLPADSRRDFLGLLARLPLLPAAVLPTRAAPTSRRQVLMNDFAIAGFRYYDGPTELPRLTAGTTLTLRAEPENPHDPFAVEILHGSAKLGYIPGSATGTSAGCCWKVLRSRAKSNEWMRRRRHGRRSTSECFSVFSGRERADSSAGELTDVTPTGPRCRQRRA